MAIFAAYETRRRIKKTEKKKQTKQNKKKTKPNKKRWISTLKCERRKS